MAVLKAYDYPGNVRELENIIENAVVLAQSDKLTPGQFPQGLQTYVGSPETISISIGTKLKDIEKEIIKATLVKTGNNKTRTAGILGIGVRTLHRKMEEYRLRK